MKFLRDEVEAAYEADSDVAIVITGYRGQLSAITLSVARRLIACKDPNIREKPPASEPAAEVDGEPGAEADPSGNGRRKRKNES